MRAGSGPASPYLVLDAGPFGSQRVPVHGHADALSIELYAYGQTFLVDPGMYGTWASVDWRNYFRGTRAHNTVVVDEQDQSILLGTRGVYRPARASVQGWVSNACFDFVDASHDGYRRLALPVVHRRQVVFVKPAYWIVLDSLTGVGGHTFDLYFHFMPDQAVSLAEETGIAQVRHVAGAMLSVVPVSGIPTSAQLISGSTDPIQGWVSFSSGQKQPAPVLRYRHTGKVPVLFATLLYPWPAGQAADVEASWIEVVAESDAGSAVADQVAGLKITSGEATDLVLVDRAPVPSSKQFAGYTSRARVAFVRQPGPRGELSCWMESG
jgi:hypothetical protein